MPRGDEGGMTGADAAPTAALGKGAEGGMTGEVPKGGEGGMEPGAFIAGGGMVPVGDAEGAMTGEVPRGGEGGIIGPAGLGLGVESWGALGVTGMAIKSSNSPPPTGFAAGEAGLGVAWTGRSESVSMASSSKASSSAGVRSEAVLGASEEARGAAKGAGVPNNPKGSSAAILRFKPSTPKAAGAGAAAEGASFSQLAQMGCILESRPKQAPQKKRWQRLQLPTASRSGWFTHGVTDMARPFP